MPIPAFVSSLRERVGTDLLWLSGVTAVVRNDRDEVLLVRRADNGLWALVSGIVEPGEEPAAALVREVLEETGVEARITGLAWVETTPEVVYANGDHARYLDLTFTAEHVAGDAVVGDDESLEVGWFPVSGLPEQLSDSARRRILHGLAFTGRARFVGDGYAGGPAPGERLATLPTPTGDVVLRRAVEADLAAIVHLLADDRLGAAREDEGDLTAYRRGFEAVDADPAQLLVVLDDGTGVVGTLQLSFIPGISHGGAWRSQVEGVRVASGRRGHGLGAAMMGWAVDESRRRGCRLLQLTTNKSRTDAHRFYERLGFRDSHEGFKLDLGSP